jgi:hypothetical protein
VDLDEARARLGRAARIFGAATRALVGSIVGDENDDTFLEGIPARYRAEHGAAFEDATLDSFKDDLEELGIVFDPVQRYDRASIALKATAHRVSVQVEKLSRARDLLLAVVSLRPLKVVNGQALHVTPEDRQRAVEWTRDITGPAWEMCRTCRHFLLDHVQNGGCVRLSCKCGERGVADAPPTDDPTNWATPSNRERAHVDGYAEGLLAGLRGQSDQYDKDKDDAAQGFMDGSLIRETITISLVERFIDLVQAFEK